MLSLRFKVLVAALIVVVVGAVLLTLTVFWPGTTHLPVFHGQEGFTTIKAKWSDQFVDSMGVNVHLQSDSYNNNGVVADTYNQVVKPRLQELGIRHIRVGLGVMSTGTKSFGTLAERLNDLANPAAGVTPITPIMVISDTKNSDGTPSSSNPESNCFMPKITLLLEGGVIPANSNCNDVGETITSHVPIQAVEGSNEPDHCASYICGTGDWFTLIEQYDPSWSDDTVKVMNVLNSKLIANSLTKNIPIYSPSLIHYADYQNRTLPDGTPLLPKMKQINQWVNAGNIHPYCAVAQSSCGATTILPAVGYYSGLSLVATEFGWSTVPGSYLTEDAQAKYYPRGFLYNYQQGLTHSYSYELLDEPQASTVKEQNFGIVKSDGTPKKAFTNLKNLLSLLSDPGTPPTLNSLSYVLSGSTTNVSQALFQKRDGSFYLLLANDAASTTTTTLPITLSLAHPMDVAEYHLDSTTPVKNQSNVASYLLTLPDQLVILKLTNVSQATTTSGSSTTTSPSLPTLSNSSPVKVAPPSSSKPIAPTPLETVTIPIIQAFTGITPLPGNANGLSIGVLIVIALLLLSLSGGVYFVTRKIMRSRHEHGRMFRKPPIS